MAEHIDAPVESWVFDRDTKPDIDERPSGRQMSGDPFWPLRQDLVSVLRGCADYIPSLGAPRVGFVNKKVKS